MLVNARSRVRTAVVVAALLLLGGVSAAVVHARSGAHRAIHAERTTRAFVADPVDPLLGVHSDPPAAHDDGPLPKPPAE